MFVPEDVASCILRGIDDLPELRKSSLISRSFLSPAQRRLFRRIEISSADRCQEFYSIAVHRSDGVASCVRDLVLEFDFGLANNPGEYVSTWLTKEETLPKILDSLTSLQSLHIVPSYVLPRYAFQLIVQSLEWATFPPTLQSSFLRLFRLPSLIHIDITSLTLPASVLSGSHQLRYLRLHGVHVVASNGSPSLMANPDTPRAQLKTLSLSPPDPTGSLSVIDELMAVIDLSQLNELILLNPDEETFEGIIRHGYAQTLERLVWSITDRLNTLGFGTNIKRIGLAIPQRLRALEVGSVNRRIGDSEINDCLAWLLRALRDLTSYPQVRVSLEAVTITLSSRFYPLHDPVPPDEYWAELDQILTTRTVFPSLRSVIVTLRVRISDDDPSQQANTWAVSMREQLPRVLAQGILDIRHVPLP